MKCACGNPMRQTVVALDDIWWSCLICGRTKPKTEGDIDMPSHRGWCDTCNKSDRPLIGTNAKICHSCYKRQNAEKKKHAADFGLNPVKAAVTVPEPVEALGVVTDIPVTLPPNWGKVPCEYCGTLLEFGRECNCSIPADEEPEPEHLTPAQNIP